MSIKILLYDIETVPNLAYVWAHYDQNVLSYEKQWEMLSFAFKWLGQKEIKCLSRREYSELELVKKLHSLFNEADFLIAHNGDEFDWKKTNAKFVEFKMKPPSPSVNIDTKKIAKKYFKFNTNSLDGLCEKLEIGRKKKHNGFELWQACMKGNVSALKKMEEYNKQDVRILERLYLKIRPWVYRQPGISLSEQPAGQCRSCGSKHIIKKGSYLSACGRKQNYQCKTCGAWSTGPFIDS